MIGEFTPIYVPFGHLIDCLIILVTYYLILITIPCALVTLVPASKEMERPALAILSSSSLEDKQGMF